VHPAVSWRRTGNGGRDAELAFRRLVRAPAMAAAVVATLTIGLGMFAVVYTVVQKILIEPMPYKDPDDLYFVWRDYRAYFVGDRDRDSPLVDVMGIRANYVEVMGMRIRAGRTFETARREGVREVLIDRHLARQFFPTGDPLGTKFPFGRDQAGRDLFVTVVGVVDQARLYDVHQDDRPQVYLRAEDAEIRFVVAWVLRSDRDPQSLIPEARAAVRRTDPRLAVSDVRTMDEIVANAVRQQRVSAVLIASFALGALLLATMGLFGVISGSVTRRAHEFAVRLALGADHGRVLRMVLGDGARLVAIGLLLGAPGIYFAGRIIRGVLVGVSPLDPLTLSAVAAGLALIAMVACYLPARSVLGLEPAQSLRQ
jgi:putative ABC transport system permease protein